MENSNSGREAADEVVGGLKKDFTVVGKQRVHAWYAWAIVGIVFGMALGIVYVANRSAQFDASQAARARMGLEMGPGFEEGNFNDEPGFNIPSAQQVPLSPEPEVVKEDGQCDCQVPKKVPYYISCVPKTGDGEAEYVVETLQMNETGSESEKSEGTETKKWVLKKDEATRWEAIGKKGLTGESCDWLNSDAAESKKCTIQCPAVVFPTDDATVNENKANAQFPDKTCSAKAEAESTGKVVCAGKPALPK